MAADGPSLDEVRARIDAIDSELLRLLDERSGLAVAVAAAKRAVGDAGRFALRPGREAQVMRRLLAAPRTAAGTPLVVRVWRELMAESLSRQGPFQLAVWGGRDLARTVELARLRFGAAPALRQTARPEEAIAAAKAPGGVGVLALAPDNGWWGRLLAEPTLNVFAALPCVSAWGPMGALAVAEVEVEPTGDDETFWVTDAGAGGGLKLFALAGFYARDDERLARAPGRLSGVIGAAPLPFDV